MKASTPTASRSTPTADAVSIGPSPPHSVQEEAENASSNQSDDPVTETELDEDEEEQSFPSLRVHINWKELGSTFGRERAYVALEKMLQRGVTQRALSEWRLNATRCKASSLAVWAVDQGNRKAYEVERALMAENSWATKSIIWEGYREDPLTVYLCAFLAHFF
jgi:hypothetical protein